MSTYFLFPPQLQRLWTIGVSAQTQLHSRDKFNGRSQISNTRDNQSLLNSVMSDATPMDPRTGKCSARNVHKCSDDLGASMNAHSQTQAQFSSHFHVLWGGGD